MTMTADSTATQLTRSPARDTLLEMAAVVRTVFGAGLEATRRATETVTVAAEAPQERVIATTTSSAGSAPTSIPVPGLSSMAPPQPLPSVPEAPTPYAGEVPALRVVPGSTAPADDVPAERRQAVLREVAFLDD